MACSPVKNPLKHENFFFNPASYLKHGLFSLQAAPAFSRYRESRKLHIIISMHNKESGWMLPLSASCHNIPSESAE
jgi:hypothetical protein